MYLDLDYHMKNRNQLAQRLKFTKSQPGGLRGNTLYLAVVIDKVINYEAEMCDLNIMVMEYGFSLLILHNWQDFITLLNGLNQQVLSHVEQ